MHSVQTILAIFNLPLKKNQLKDFRGAWIDQFAKHNILFHHHIEGGKYDYNYPNVYYRVINGNAALVGLNEGADAIDNLLKLLVEEKRLEKFLLYGKELKTPFYLINTPIKQNLDLIIQPDIRASSYRINDYLPIAAKNSRTYHNTDNKKKLLHQLLENHIKDFCKGVKWKYQPQRFEINIKSYYKIEECKTHDIDFISYNIEFTSNALLPSGICIGPKKSFGHGWIERLY